MLFPSSPKLTKKTQKSESKSFPPIFGRSCLKQPQNKAWRGNCNKHGCGAWDLSYDAPLTFLPQTSAQAIVMTTLSLLLEQSDQTERIHAVHPWKDDHANVTEVLKMSLVLFSFG